MSAQKLTFWFAGTLALGVFAGFGLAITMTRTEIQVDFDSGAIREVISIGPIIAREDEIERSFFGSIRVPDGGTALTGSKNWHVGHRFTGNSKVSPLFEAGQVLNDISRLEGLPWKGSPLSLPSVKEQYLLALSTHGVESASQVAHEAEQRILDSLTNGPAKN